MKIAITALLAFNTTYMTAQTQQVPQAPMQAKTLEIHGHRREDPFFWMNERDSPEVLTYIGQENAYSAAFFKSQQHFTQTLLTEFEQRINPNEISAPFEINDLTFQWRNLEGKDYRQLLAWKTGSESIIYLDENERAREHSYYHLGDFSLNEDNQYVAFSEDTVGRRNYTIHIRDNHSGQLLNETIPQTDGSVVWAHGSNKPCLLYIRKDEQTLREFQVFIHILGDDPANDRLLYEETDERFYVGIQLSIDKRYVFIQSTSSTTSETWLFNCSEPEQALHCFLKRDPGHLYDVEHHEHGFYILSNFEAPDKKLLFTSELPESLTACEIIMAHTPGTYLENMQLLKSFLLVQTKTSGQSELRYTPVEKTVWKTLDFPENVYEIGFGHNENYNSNYVYYFYTSLTTPSRLYRFYPESGTHELVFEKKLIDPSFDPGNYQTERVWINAEDGTKVPVSLVYKKGVDLKNAPLLLYGYGSYGITIPCSFSAFRVSLLDRGFIYAIAHIRGGKFLGEHWYQDGKMMHKRNTFTDFIACSEALPKLGYGKAGHIYAEGGSAGGLLMGAVANMAASRFRGIIAQVPFVDVVTTMLDESIPLTVGEYEEWGNPNEKEAYEYMLSYSPYDQVQKQDYPAMYITTGYHDSQVQYWEPLKWVAKLRLMNTSQNPVYFDCTMEAGHGGGSGITTERLEIAKEFTFLCYLEKLL